jgi:hypothetical protein
MNIRGPKKVYSFALPSYRQPRLATVADAHGSNFDGNNDFFVLLRKAS